jgi:two-component system sensor histidine kinase BaeS
VKSRRRSFPPLRRRLFFATALIVVASIGVTFAVGVVLTRRAVERANLDDLGHQADLLAQREREALLAFSKLRTLRVYLDKQDERIEVFRLRRPLAFVPDQLAADLRAGRPARGTISIHGQRYLYAARAVQAQGFVLLRPKSRAAAGWGSFLQALLIAVLVGAALAAVGSLLLARAISRPVRRVAEASRSLADGISPKPVPAEGSAELALLASSFNEMADDLQKAREAERNFLLSVSHELKTPLAAIRGYAEGLDEGVIAAEEAAVTIREESRRLERLVRDLLDLARMNRREFVVHREEIDLAVVAREVVRRCEPEARACGVELEALGSEPSLAQGDPDRILQVASNLVENALRSTPPGGTVRVRAEPGLLTVEDTGVGLPPDDLPHAFERFYLHDRNPDGRRRIGTGLGLAIVKELTERMGGTVSVRSTVGAGTTFAVQLPPARARVGTKELTPAG